MYKPCPYPVHAIISVIYNPHPRPDPKPIPPEPLLRRRNLNRPFLTPLRPPHNPHFDRDLDANKRPEQRIRSRAQRHRRADGDAQVSGVQVEEPVHLGHGEPGADTEGDEDGRHGGGCEVPGRAGGRDSRDSRLSSVVLEGVCGLVGGEGGRRRGTRVDGGEGSEALVVKGSDNAGLRFG